MGGVGTSLVICLEAASKASNHFSLRRNTSGGGLVLDNSAGEVAKDSHA